MTRHAAVRTGPATCDAVRTPGRRLPPARPSARPRAARQATGALLALLAATLTTGALAQTGGGDAAAVERGRYLVKITGCNDCHTPGYTARAGQVPEKDWLVGDALGWQGPWGTTYAPNLRRYFAGLSEAQWLQHARTMQWRPPMPWFGLRDMTDADLKAVYAYVRAAGPAGEPAPAYLPPGTAAKGPVVRFP
ncbi:c-type cytochrome [Piscinibacter sakaiensis]|uniref:Cytochrome c mono-and diheme variant n=1 Tax=Piscinibacter sakaiensis TaxID=1547922 RepID=A0A0K8NZV0_PISS1|nr:c-type cytochrome [Piscinibacter sakaiensis]GAP35903.1 cytochrome c mono- and diheme variant [Piscinibacter sakaiensis]